MRGGDKPAADVQPQLFGLAVNIISIPAFKSGVGYHIDDLTYGEVFAGLHWLWVGLPIGVLATCIAKLAIVSIFVQVTTIAQPKRRWFLIATGVVNSIAGLTQVAISLTQCDPYQRLWYRYLPGSCPRAEFAAQYSYFQGGSSKRSRLDSRSVPYLHCMELESVQEGQVRLLCAYGWWLDVSRLLSRRF